MSNGHRVDVEELLLSEADHIDLIVASGAEDVTEQLVIAMLVDKSLLLSL